MTRRRIVGEKADVGVCACLGCVSNDTLQEGWPGQVLSSPTSRKKADIRLVR
jgi:hypothetical protein